MSDVSWVLPVYNEEPEIARCLDSIVNQTMKPREIIVLDDGSTDKTAHIVEQFAKRHDNVMLVRDTVRRGAAPRRNAGMRMATGKYMKPADTALYHPRVTEWVQTKFDENLDIDIVVGWHIGKPRNELCLDLLYQPINRHMDINLYRNGLCRGANSSVAYRRDMVMKYGWPEVSRETDCYEEVFFMMKQGGHKFGVVEQNFACWSRGTSHRDKEDAHKVRQAYYEKYGVSMGPGV